MGSLALRTVAAEEAVVAARDTSRPHADVGQPAHAPALAFDLVRDRAGFDALEAEWNALFDRAARDIHVFQTYNWLWHWTRNFLDTSPAARDSLAILVGRENGRAVLIWPLLLEQRALVRRLSFMGEPASQYGDVLIEPREDTAAILDAAVAHLKAALKPDVLRLRKVRHDAAIRPFLDTRRAIATDRLEAPYLDLASAASFEDYEQRYSAKARKNRRRLLRRLGERAPVEMTSPVTGDAAREAAHVAVSLKRAWLKERGLISPAIADNRLASFLADAVSCERHPTGARVSVLTSGGETASIEIGFAAKGRLALHLIVYSLKFEKSGAGVLHLEDTVRRAKEAGVTTLDLLAPKADYKMEWADAAVPVADYTLPLTWTGRIYGSIYLGFLRERFKSALEHLPLSVRKLAAGMLALWHTPPL